VQAEIDQARRRVQVAKVIKVAKQIRLDQRARARARDAKEPADDDDDGSAEAPSSP
jgi:predicted transcriptional regulator